MSEQLFNNTSAQKVRIRLNAIMLSVKNIHLKWSRNFTKFTK